MTVIRVCIVDTSLCTYQDYVSFVSYLQSSFIVNIGIFGWILRGNGILFFYEVPVRLVSSPDSVFLSP